MFTRRMFAKAFSLAMIMLVLAGLNPAKAQYGYQPTLTSATIAFHTNDENKDWDTRVTTIVFASNGAQAARVDGISGEFNDGTNNGPFALGIQQVGLTKDRFNGGQLGIWIQPNGNDTWRFNATISLYFSDGSVIRKEYGGMRLDEDNTGMRLQL